MTPTLSILICSLVCRDRSLRKLLAQLAEQVGDNEAVEIHVAQDDGLVPIGTKRNELLARANGGWIAYVDDDDRVAEDYVASILDALKTRPDCVGFKSHRIQDGRFVGVGIHRLAHAKYDVRAGAGDEGRIYERPINHLCPVKRELAQLVGFPNQDRGEDSSYALRLRKHLKTESFIDRVLYFYDYRSPRLRKGEVSHLNRKS